QAQRCFGRRVPQTECFAEITHVLFAGRGRRPDPILAQGRPWHPNRPEREDSTTSETKTQSKRVAHRNSESNGLSDSDRPQSLQTDAAEQGLFRGGRAGVRWAFSTFRARF